MYRTICKPRIGHRRTYILAIVLVHAKKSTIKSPVLQQAACGSLEVVEIRAGTPMAIRSSGHNVRTLTSTSSEYMNLWWACKRRPGHDQALMAKSTALARAAHCLYRLLETDGREGGKGDPRPLISHR